MTEDKAKQIEDFLQRAQQGDREALNRLALAVEEILRSYFLGKFKNRDLVEDLVQDAYIRFHEAFSKLTKPTNFRGFVAQIALRTSQDYFRRKYVRSDVRTFSALEKTDDDEKEVEFADPEYGEEIELNRLTVAHAISRLPEMTQKVLWLKMDGVHYEDIAKQLGLSLSAVKMRVQRGIMFLKNEVFV